MSPGTDVILDREFMAKLDQLGLISKKIFAGKLKGERRSKKKGISSEFADYRNYAIGDDFRFIDWNIYARLDRLFLKLFMEEEDLFVYILIDTSASMGFGEPQKMRYAQKIAMALGYIAMINLDNLAIETFSNSLVAAMKPARGKKELSRFFGFVSDVSPDGGTSLVETCKKFAAKHRRKGIVLLISDFLDKDGYEDALKYIIGTGHELFALHILSREEIEPAFVGDLKLVDSEDGTTSEVSISKALLSRYGQTLSGFLGGLKDFCFKRGANYCFTPTDNPFEDVVLRYLREIGLVK